MSTTDILLTDILSTLKGLSPPSIKGITPPPILSTINKSIETLQGKLTEVIDTLNTDLTGAIGTLKTDLTEVINASSTKIAEKLGTNWILEGLNLIIGVAGLFRVETLEKVLKKITPIISKIMSTFKALGPLIISIFASIKTAMIPVLSSLSTMTARVIQAGLSFITTGTQAAAAWVAGLGPIAWVIATVVGVFALVATNIDYLQGAWGKFVSWFSTSFPDLSKLLEPVTNTITWILEKIKQITEFGGGIVDKLFGKDSTDQVAPPVLAQQVFTPISAPSQVLLPKTPTSIINKASVAPKYIPVTPNLTKVATVVNTPNKEDLVTNGNKITFNTSMFGNSSHGAKGASSSTSQTTNHNQTVYNIGQIDIADGVIYEIEDFLASVRRRANTIRNASNIA